MIVANDELVKITSINESLKSRNKQLELKLVILESLKSENEYLKNKVLCASQIEEFLRKQIF